MVLISILYTVRPVLGLWLGLPASTLNPYDKILSSILSLQIICCPLYQSLKPNK